MFAGGTLIVNAAVFYSNYTDVQLTTIGSTASGALLLLTRNVGNAEIYGAEAEVTWQPANQITLNATGGYLNSSWDKFSFDNCNPAVFSATSGRFCDVDLSLDDRLIDSPEWTLNLGGEFRQPVRDVGQLAFRVDASYRSETWKDPFNLGRGPNAFGVLDPRATLPTAGPYYAIGLPELKQDGYWLVNLRLGFTNPAKTWEIAAAVTNVFDEQYITNVTPVTTFGYDEAYVGRPREWSLSARYRF